MSVPVDVSIALFVVPPAIAWLPISILPLVIFHDESAVWFAIAPGLILGGPLVLLSGTPGYLLTEKPGPETATVTTAAVTSAQTAPVSSDVSPSAR